MNGSRSTPSRPAETSSLDALSRTIEGLEARIEGLIASGAKDPRQAGEARREPARDQRPAENRPAPERDARFDPLAEIRQRQKALEVSRARALERSRDQRTAEREAVSATPAERPAAHPAPRADLLANEITQALLNLRQDLKKDISEGFTREIGMLRSEIQSLKAIAGDHRPDDGMREDLSRLADSINHLGQHAAPDTDSLRSEFEELRSLMDGLAREQTVRHMETRWSGLEDRLQGLSADALRDDLMHLVDRLDDIKGQLGAMSDNRAIRALEEKLIAVATALEHIGAHIDPTERAMQDQFTGLDLRLDEITRAIAASNRNPASNVDARLIERLEDRIAGIATQIDTIADGATMRDEPSDEVARRLEALAERVEQLANERSTGHLEERLDQLSLLLERSQQPVAQPELTDYLFDISRKIDALDHGSVNDRLAERLDHIATLISDLDQQQQPAAATDDRLLRNLEDRLAVIAERLEETTHAAPSDTGSLRGLEEQIAHLSQLINASPSTGAAQDDRLTGRVAALEEYMASSDEYIIEAARQAAEAVMESYSHQASAPGGSVQPNLDTIAALADNLRHLEDISRDSDQRTHKTFESLQDTLVQIAERLDSLHSTTSAAPTYAEPLFHVEEKPVAASTASRAYSDESPSAVAAPRRDERQQPSERAELAQSTLAMAADTVEAPTEPSKPARPSLLAGLGKRLLPGQKNEGEAATARQLIDPAPSIDPADVIPPEEANVLLEPGSGAPDVRKILERVRASKTSQANGAELSPVTEADRTDYIAAARRAAQAAAQEATRAPGSATPLGDALQPSGASAFARYRRPILMAAGAILLAVMAMPLVRTLTQGDNAPPVTIEAPLEDSTAPREAAPQDAPAPAATTNELPAPVITEEAAPAEELVPQDAAPMEPMTDAVGPDAVVPDTIVPTDETGAADMAPDSSATTTEASPPVTDMPETAAAPAAPAYEIPQAIAPPSLAKAAAEGDPLALFEIGARYTEGRGVGTDLSEAAVWYKRAADKGFAPAQYRLANLYEKGTGIERDNDMARQYYQMAADSGNASAMHNLAVLYASGGAGTQDYAKAAEWFGKAAEFGVSDSQFNLAILYARGNGVSQDLETSYKWFAIAAKDGDKDAAQKRDDVANAMRPEQLEKARAAVDLWKPTPLNVDANSVDLPDEWIGKGTKTASVDMKKVIRNVQAILNNNGFDAGAPDGIMGKKTVAAIKQFQTSVGQEPTGQLNDALVTELLARNK